MTHHTDTRRLALDAALKLAYPAEPAEHTIERATKLAEYLQPAPVKRPSLIDMVREMYLHLDMTGLGALEDDNPALIGLRAALLEAKKALSEEPSA